MAISVISVSSDSSEGSVGTPAGRVILFGTIPTTIPDTTPMITPPTTQTDATVIPTEIPIIASTIPLSPDYTPASLDYSYASDTESNPSEDPSLKHILPLPAISPFLSSDDDTTDSNTPDTPPSPTHDDLARDSSSDSSSKASSDFHSDASSDSFSSHSLSDHSSPDLPSISAGTSHERRKSFMTFILALPLVSGTLSPVCADLIPSPERVRDSGYLADVEVDLREASLRDDVMVGGSDEPRLEQDIDLKIQAEIGEYITYTYALRDKGINARVVVQAVYREESETGTRGPIEVRVEKVTLPMMLEDTPEPAQEERDLECTYETLGSLVQRFHDRIETILVRRIHAIEEVQREQGRRIVRVESVVTTLTERIVKLERDNKRLRGTDSVESQRVDRLQRGMKMPNTRSGASMTHEEVEELVARRVAEEMEAHEAAMNLEPLNESWDEQEGKNRGNGNRGYEENGNRANQDSLNAAAGGNLLEKSPQDALTIIEIKSKCLAVGGNTFPEYRDNIQGYVSVAIGNYNQGNPGYRPQGVANQMRPPATQSNQNYHLNELEKIKRMNDVSLKAMQNQIDMVKNELRNEMKNSIQTSLSNQTNEIKNMMAILLQMNIAFTSGSGTLPGNTIANPKGELKAITTHSGLVTEGPSVPNPPKSVNPEEDECVEEMYTDPDHAEYTIKVPPPPPV
nr:hypothetical protein [Tanacetum cinerariifolium]